MPFSGEISAKQTKTAVLCRPISHDQPSKKKLYIYIIYKLYYIILYHIILYYIILYYVYIHYIILCYIYIYIYIYIFVQFFCRRFSRDQPSKKINIFVQFFRSQPSPPNRKKNKHTFCSFFCHRFARGQPSKKYKFEKNTYIYIYICVSVFFPLIFPPPALKKI